MAFPFEEFASASGGEYLEGDYLESGEGPSILWEPHRGPQKALLDSNVYEVLYGGARGGGKTDAMLADLAKHASRYASGARGVFFRRTLPQLEDAIRRSKELYGMIGATYRESKKTWFFPNGASLKFRYLERDEDAEAYKGQQFSWVCFEELTQWAKSDPVDKIRACLRSAEGVPVFFRATSNPGGPGHGWVKARYYTPHPLGYRIITDPESELKRCFIPARLEHNPTLEQNDPTYRQRLKSLGNPALVDAWLNGSWDIADGGFFDGVWSPGKHISKRFKIPASWPLSTSFDWGYAKPASFGFWAESNGEQPENASAFYPSGTLVRVAEWYTVKRNGLGIPEPDKGLKINNERLGEQIYKQFIKPFEKRITLQVADPSIFSQESQSIYKKMREGARAVGGDLEFRRVDNSRVTGWQEMIDRMTATFEDDRERPGLVIFETCENWIRTVPVLSRDPNNGNDINSKEEDHAADETRYRCNASKNSMRELRINA